jgi:hypothetical protein
MGTKVVDQFRRSRIIAKALIKELFRRHSSRPDIVIPDSAFEPDGAYESVVKAIVKLLYRQLDVRKAITQLTPMKMVNDPSAFVNIVLDGALEDNPSDAVLKFVRWLVGQSSGNVDPVFGQLIARVSGVAGFEGQAPAFVREQQQRPDVPGEEKEPQPGVQPEVKESVEDKIKKIITRATTTPGDSDELVGDAKNALQQIEGLSPEEIKAILDKIENKLRQRERPQPPPPRRGGTIIEELVEKMVGILGNISTLRFAPKQSENSLRRFIDKNKAYEGIAQHIKDADAVKIMQRVEAILLSREQEVKDEPSAEDARAKEKQIKDKKEQQRLATEAKLDLDEQLSVEIWQMNEALRDYEQFLPLQESAIDPAILGLANPVDPNSTIVMDELPNINTELTQDDRKEAPVDPDHVQIPGQVQFLTPLNSQPLPNTVPVHIPGMSGSLADKLTSTQRDATTRMEGQSERTNMASLDETLLRVNQLVQAFPAHDSPRKEFQRRIEDMPKSMTAERNTLEQRASKIEDAMQKIFHQFKNRMEADGSDEEVDGVLEQFRKGLWALGSRAVEMTNLGDARWDTIDWVPLLSAVLMARNIGAVGQKGAGLGADTILAGMGLASGSVGYIRDWIISSLQARGDSPDDEITINQAGADRDEKDETVEPHEKGHQEGPERDRFHNLGDWWTKINPQAREHVASSDLARWRKIAQSIIQNRGVKLPSSFGDVSSMDGAGLARLYDWFFRPGGDAGYIPAAPFTPGEEEEEEKKTSPAPGDPRDPSPAGEEPSQNIKLDFPERKFDVSQLRNHVKKVQDLRPTFKQLGTDVDKLTPPEEMRERMKFALFDHIQPGYGAPRGDTLRGMNERFNQMRYDTPINTNLYPQLNAGQLLNIKPTYDSSPANVNPMQMAFLRQRSAVENSLLLRDIHNNSANLLPAVGLNNVSPSIGMARTTPPDTSYSAYRMTNQVIYPPQGTARPVVPPGQNGVTSSKRTSAGLAFDVPPYQYGTYWLNAFPRNGVPQYRSEWAPGSNSMPQEPTLEGVMNGLDLSYMSQVSPTPLPWAIDPAMTNPRSFKSTMGFPTRVEMA